MLKILSESIYQIYKFTSGIVSWGLINIPVSWLSFFIAIIGLARNNHNKLRQRFDYSSVTHPCNTVITVYNDSLVTETSRFNGIIVTAKKPNLLRKKVIKWNLKNKKFGHNKQLLFPFHQMVNIQNNDEIKQSDFFAVKSHEMREIIINKKNFLNSIKNKLYSNIKALTKFTNKKAFYVYFVYETVTGKTRMFAVKIIFDDPIGQDLNIDDCNKVLQAKLKYNN